MRLFGLAIFGLGLGLLLLAGIALVFDLGTLKPVYERIASHYLAREVCVEGEMSVRLGRSVTASAKDVTILSTDPDGTPLARADFLEVQLALPALFDRLVDIELARIEGATLNLEIDDQGQGNWPTFRDDGPAQADRSDESDQAEDRSDVALRITEAQVTGSAINFYDAGSDTRHALSIDRFDGLMSADTTEASGTCTLNERAFETTLTLDGVESLLTLAQWDVDWRGQIGRAQFQATGHLEALDELEASQLALTLHTDSANELLDTLSLPPIDDGPVDINFRLSQQANTAHLDLHAVFGEFSIFGTALSEDPLTLRSAQLDLVATGPNLAHLGALSGQDNWPETAFEIDLKTSREGRQVEVSTLRLISEVMDLELTGSVADYRSPGTGQLSGTVDIPSLSVGSSVLNLPSELSGPFSGTVSLTGEGTGADLVVSSQSNLFSLDLGGRLEPGESMLGSTMRMQGQIARPERFLSLFMADAPTLPPAAFEGQFAIEEAADRLVPDFPLTHPLLSAFQADTTVSIRELKGLARPVVNVLTAIELGREGVRVTSASAGNERGGVATLTGTLIPNAEGVPELSMLLEGSDLVLGIPTAPGEDIAPLPPYALRLKVDGAGRTTRELAASLDGYLNMTMSEGIVLNAGLDRVTNSFLQELSKALDPLQEQEESTKINCAAAFSVVSQGRLHGKPAVVVDTPNVKVLADATANLDSEKIKVQFKTVPQKGLGLSMSSIVNPYIEVTGTLAQPRLTLNPENTVVGGSLAVITGGISILVRNVLDRLSTSGNVCADRLRKANEEMAQMDA